LVLAAACFEEVFFAAITLIYPDCYRCPPIRIIRAHFLAKSKR
jgi:hypothetical protein